MTSVCLAVTIIRWAIGMPSKCLLNNLYLIKFKWKLKHLMVLLLYLDCNSASCAFFYLIFLSPNFFLIQFDLFTLELDWVLWFVSIGLVWSFCQCREISWCFGKYFKICDNYSLSKSIIAFLNIIVKIVWIVILRSLIPPHFKRTLLREICN